MGPRKIEFTIHSTLVAKQSPKLNALVTNGMKESVEQCAHWEDEDAETFQRFAEFVYSGKYAVDSPRKRGSDSAAGKKRKLPEDPYRESLSYGRRLWRDNIWEGFEKMHAAPPLDATPSRTRPEEDYTPVFLAHAKMYVFADYHDIKALRTLSLQYLRRLLTVFELRMESAQDVVELLDYGFSNTHEAEGSVNDLRELLSLYAAYKLDLLWKKDSFRDLVESKCSLALVRQFLKG